MNTKHTPGPWFVIADMACKGKHPLHDARYIATCDESKTEVYNHNYEETGWRFEDPKDSIICTMPDAENQKSNARLIAAAPELLEACKLGMRAARSLGWDQAKDGPAAQLGEWFAKMEAAIAKAQG